MGAREAFSPSTTLKLSQYLHPESNASKSFTCLVVVVVVYVACGVCLRMSVRGCVCVWVGVGDGQRKHTQKEGKLWNRLSLVLHICVGVVIGGQLKVDITYINTSSLRLFAVSATRSIRPHEVTA